MKFSVGRLWRIGGPVLWLTLAALYALLFFRVMASPEQRTGSDFIAFYSAGRIVREEGFSQVYNIQAQHQIQQRVVGFPLRADQVLLYNHLPFLLPILALVAVSDYLLAFLVWQSILIALIAGALIIVFRFSPGLAAPEKWAAALFFPLFFSLLNGQDSAVALFALAAWMFFLIRQQDFLAGLALSLLAVRPQWAILFCIPFLFHRRAVGAGALTGAVALALLSVGLLGWQGVQNFLQIVSISAGGAWYGMKENAMFNLLGILARAFPTNLPQARLIAWAATIFLGVASVFLWRSPKISFLDKISWQMVAACFVSPHLHFHDLSILIFPLLLNVPAYQKALGWKIPAWAFFLLLSLALVFSQAQETFKFFSAYLLLALLAFGLLWRRKGTHDLA